MAHRAYVRVLVDVDETGKVCPRRIYWEDGRAFVETARPGHALHLSRAGARGVPVRG